jgi:hypothetical protein
MGVASVIEQALNACLVDSLQRGTLPATRRPEKRSLPTHVSSRLRVEQGPRTPPRTQLSAHPEVDRAQCAATPVRSVCPAAAPRSEILRPPSDVVAAVPTDQLLAAAVSLRPSAGRRPIAFGLRLLTRWFRSPDWSADDQAEFARRLTSAWAFSRPQYLASTRSRRWSMAGMSSLVFGSQRFRHAVARARLATPPAARSNVHGKGVSPGPAERECTRAVAVELFALARLTTEGSCKQDF